MACLIVLNVLTSMFAVVRRTSLDFSADNLPCRGDLQAGLQSLQSQFGEMRDFLEVQFSLHRELLDRIVSRAAPEHSTAVSPMFLGIGNVPSNGHDRASLGSVGGLHPIQEDRDPDGFGQTGPAQKATKGAQMSWSKFDQVPPSENEYASQAQLRAQNLQAKQLRRTTQAAHAQFRKRNWRSCVKEIIFSPWFSLAITFLILLNVVLLGVEVDVSATLDLDEVPSWFGTVNALIVFIFVVEMILRIFVLGCREFWCGVESGWNIFDSLIVSLSVVDLVVDALASLMSASLDTGHLRFMRSIRIARAIRGIRVVRLFRYVTALRTLALSIISTMSSLFWTLALLVLVFYLFAVVITQLVLDHCRHAACPELLHKFWGSVPESSWSYLVFVFSPHLCAGFLFLILYPPSSAPLPLRHLQPWFTHTHNFVTNTTLSHTISLTHNFITHHQSHTQSFVTLSFTHNFVAHHFVTHNFVTHHLSHTTLSHTHTHHSSHTHTHLCNHLSHTHTICVTHSFVTHHFVTHTQLCHTPSHTQLCHRPSFTHNFVTHHLVAGVALGDIHLRFAWHAWHLWPWAGSGGALGRRWSPVTPRHFCVAGVALGDIPFVSRGMCGIW